MDLTLFLLLISPYLNYALPIENVQREVHTLHSLISDLQLNQKELRQSSNDHTIVDWLKETVVDLRRQMNEWIIKDRSDLHQLKESLTSEFGHRVEKELRQVRLQMGELKVHQARHQAFMEEMKPKVNKAKKKNGTSSRTNFLFKNYRFVTIQRILLIM